MIAVMTCNYQKDEFALSYLDLVMSHIVYALHGRELIWPVRVRTQAGGVKVPYRKEKPGCLQIAGG
jgi:hypothetical protein